MDRLAVLALLQQCIRHPDFACDDDAVRGRQRLAGNAHVPGIHPGLLRLPIDQVHDLIGNTVANLVRMTFGHGFAGEKIVLPPHGCPLLKKLAVAPDSGAAPCSEHHSKSSSRLSAARHSGRAMDAASSSNYSRIYSSPPEASALTRSTTLRRTFASLIRTKAPLSGGPSELFRVHDIGRRVVLGHSANAAVFLSRHILEKEGHLHTENG